MGNLFSSPDASAHLKQEECLRLKFLQAKVLSSVELQKAKLYGTRKLIKRHGILVGLVPS